ncbi:acetylxylan esterase [Persicitalea sp.]|uniref:alpha/beta hydrolase n=1 Tax=Persicitalea sp. TaxID=3100273 RepID=UPI003593DA41
MNFLKTGSLFVVLLFLGRVYDVYAQEELSVFNYWRAFDGVPAMSLYRHLYQRAGSQLAERKAVVEKLTSQADWQKRQSSVKAKLTAAIGEFPNKTPLSPVVTGTIEREDFKVEKLYFESLPGFYVTAALFIPKVRRGKSPAILYCSGHSPTGFRSDIYQHNILNYVKKGFVVLAFDPIGQGERKSYAESKGLGSPTKEHSYPGTQSFVSGLSPAQYFVWDGIRAIDYLVSRPEVDAARLGITGRSGGGTQATYIAALDERVLAAAPECYITTYDKQLLSRGPQDAEQILLHMLEKGLDLPDLIELRAPKPTLIVSTTSDIFSIQGVRDTYDEAKGAFAAFGKAQQLIKVEDDAGHASTPKNREATYAFFQKYLDNPGSSKDEEVEKFGVEELYATPTGDMLQTLYGESLFSLNLKYTREVVQKRKSNPKAADNIRESAIRLSGYEIPSTKRDVIFSGRIHRTNYAIEKYLVKGSGEYHISALWLKPEKASDKLVLLLDERGKTLALAKGELADQLAREGYEVIVPDLSGIGESSTGYLTGGDSFIKGVPMNLWYAGLLTNKSLVAVRAEEISILTDFIKRESTIKGVTAIAHGTLTSDLLHSAVFSDSFDRIILSNPLISYQSIAEQQMYEPKFVMSSVAGALQAYDLPDLVASLSPHPMLLLNPIDATGAGIGKKEIEAVYHDALQKPSGKNLTIGSAVKQVNLPVAVIKWMSQEIADSEANGKRE